MSDHGLSPTAALRVVRAVLCDHAIPPSQRNVVGMVALSASNGTGKAWASYRSLRDQTGAGLCTIGKALAYAEGRYLRRVRRGRHGAFCYQVLTPPGKSPSATEGEALEDDPALPSGTAALPRGTPALPSERVSATEAVDKLTLQTGSETDAARRRPVPGKGPVAAGAETGSPPSAAPPAPDGAAPLPASDTVAGSNGMTQPRGVPLIGISRQLDELLHGTRGAIAEGDMTVEERRRRFLGQSQERR